MALFNCFPTIATERSEYYTTRLCYCVMTSAHQKPELECVKHLDLRDNLLLETGFLAILIAPMKMPWSSKVRLHDSVTFWLARWLLFRLMFASGVVKLTSRCPTWWGLTGEESAEIWRIYLFPHVLDLLLVQHVCKTTVFTVCEHSVAYSVPKCSALELISCVTNEPEAKSMVC